MFSSDVLAKIIRFYGNAMQGMMGSYLEKNVQAFTDIQNKFKAGNVEAIAPNAEVIAITALQIPTLFPEGSLTEKSKAKPELWQRRDEFDKAAKNLAVWSERLRDASKAKDEKAVADIMKDYGRVGCGSCHTPFRQPPPRS